MSKMPTEYLAFRKIGFLSPLAQGGIVVALGIFTLLLMHAGYTTKGMAFDYPFSIHILFVPIYEEIIFRGIMLAYLVRRTSIMKAVVITSILFALWHLKNMFVLIPELLLYQMAYVGIIVSPILSYITLKTKSIWIGVMLHYLNNLASPLSWILLWSVFERM